MYHGLVHKLRHRSTRYVSEHRFTNEITQCNGHYAVQGHLRSPILVPIESSYRLPIIVINTNLGLRPILHRSDFR